MKRYVLGVMLNSLPLMSCAFAQSAVQTPAFETLDTDGNGLFLVTRRVHCGAWLAATTISNASPKKP